MVSWSRMMIRESHHHHHHSHHHHHGTAARGWQGQHSKPYHDRHTCLNEMCALVRQISLAGISSLFWICCHWLGRPPHNLHVDRAAAVHVQQPGQRVCVPHCALTLAGVAGSVCMGAGAAWPARFCMRLLCHTADIRVCLTCCWCCVLAAAGALGACWPAGCFSTRVCLRG